MQHCAKCGVRLADDANFCTACGARVVWPEPRGRHSMDRTERRLRRRVMRTYSVVMRWGVPPVPLSLSTRILRACLWGAVSVPWAAAAYEAMGAGEVWLSAAAVLGCTLGPLGYYVTAVRHPSRLTEAQRARALEAAKAEHGKAQMELSAWLYERAAARGERFKPAPPPC